MIVVETFTLFVLLAANICGPIPPTWQSHECGMPRPIAEHLSKHDCEQRRRETLRAGNDAYCVSDTAKHDQTFTFFAWSIAALPLSETHRPHTLKDDGPRIYRRGGFTKEECERSVQAIVKEGPDIRAFCAPDPR
jgi:hypothetical protein